MPKNLIDDWRVSLLRDRATEAHPYEMALDPFGVSLHSISRPDSPLQFGAVPGKLGLIIPARRWTTGLWEIRGDLWPKGFRVLYGGQDLDFAVKVSNPVDNWLLIFQTVPVGCLTFHRPDSPDPVPLEEFVPIVFSEILGRYTVRIPIPFPFDFFEIQDLERRVTRSHFVEGFPTPAFFFRRLSRAGIIPSMETPGVDLEEIPLDLLPNPF